MQSHRNLKRYPIAVLVLAGIGLSSLAGPAAAKSPTDPSASGQQPLQIMRIGQALDGLPKPLVDINVAPLDTGIDLDHPDLASRLVTLSAAKLAPYAYGPSPYTAPAGGHGWDLIGNLNACMPGAEAPDSDPSDPVGCSSHGTAVAGILGAAWNNGQGGAGIAPNARFLALRTCWDDDQCYAQHQPVAIDFAADLGVRVISFSWLAPPPNAELDAAIAGHPNILFVGIPSGNGGAYDADPDNPYPCDLPYANVLCVSTSSPSDGLDCGAYGATTVDVAVPTQNSVTTVNGGGFGPTGCATSFASPTAAGLATILFGEVPSATGAQVRNAIIAGARKVPAWQGKSVSGGVADAVGALAALGVKPVAAKCKKKKKKKKNRDAALAKTKKKKKKCGSKKKKKKR